MGPAPGMPLPFDWCHEPWSPALEGQVHRSMELLTKSIRLLRANGVKVVVSAVPLREQFEGKFSRLPLDTVQAVAEAEGVPYFDVFSALRKEFGPAPAAEFYIPADMHFNTRGNNAWAKAYLAYLRAPDRDLLPSPWLEVSN